MSIPKQPYDSTKQHHSLMVLFFFICLSAQNLSALEPLNAAEIKDRIQKLGVFGSVLYVAAHPDDENTQLIAFLAGQRQYDTTYLSLTRGDGGQNLIGSDLKERLGLIRTQELLAARDVDGGFQKFTRAVDFGFSKSYEESFEIWGREQILEDVVRVVRQTRPDVIITRFSPEPGFTHGHHTASTLLAMEAFTLAADANAFAETLGHLEPWQAKRIVWNVSWWHFSQRGEEFPTEKFASMEVGLFDYGLGETFPQIAARSRSQHQSQGFGTIASLSGETEYFQLLDGEPIGNDLFSGINTDSSRLSDDSTYSLLINESLQNYDPENPWKSVGSLIKVKECLEEMEPSYWRDRKLSEADLLIFAAISLEAQLNAKQQILPLESNAELDIKIVHRSPVEVQLNSITLSSTTQPINQVLQPYTVFESPILAKLASATATSQPYWLSKTPSLGQFHIPDPEAVGKPIDDPLVVASIQLEIAGKPLSFNLPAKYRFRDPVKGEVVQPIIITPQANVSLSQNLILAAAQNEQTLSVTVKSNAPNMAGNLMVEVEGEWKLIDYQPVPVTLENAGDEFTVLLTVMPPQHSGESILRAYLVTDSGLRFDRGLEIMSYDHIPQIPLFPAAETRLVRLDAQIAGSRIGYLPGAGDVIPDSLRLLGYTVTEFNPALPASTNLDGYDAIVLGIRALNVHDNIDAWLDRLLPYATNGGTVIVQYNTDRGLKTDRLTSDFFKLSRDRVTDEFAPMRILASNHPVLNAPNKITEADFNGWVQERGLYFANAWGPEFTPILSANDSGEPPRDGSLLISQQGEGWFVYTGISFFRQLPEGVPGAYRLFANLVSLSHAEPESE
ncbi:MAG: PIG-L family deacetylase [Sumerlaeia bacterium]